MSIPINFGKSHKVELEAVEGSSDLSIGGRNYKIIGDHKDTALLMSYFKSLNEYSFESVKSFEAKLVNIDKAEKIDQFLESAVRELDFRGAVSVVHKGKLLVNKGYGVEGITDRTIFHLASITKQFTAAAILLLQQRDPNFSVNDPINKHLPKEFQNPIWDKITIHQLLNHTSGIPGGGVDEPGKEREYELKEIIREMMDKPLIFDPGTAWSYSNPGYWLLGAIIEHESHMTYREFIQQNIFDPLEMNSSGVGNNYDKHKAATGYQNKSPIDNQGIHLSKAHAAGAITSTTEDMRKWDAALYSDNLLSAESKRLMFQSDDYPMFMEKDVTTQYGYGFSISKNNQMGKVIAHNGRIPGFSTLIVRYPETQSCIIILSNNEDVDMPKVCNPIEDIITAS